MSVPPYFFAADLGEAPGEVTLAGDEARHAQAARRLAVGEAVALFDGRGRVAQGRVEAARRGALVLRIERVSRRPEPRPLVLASALPKGDRLAVLLDMATQLGMTRFVPLQCARSVVRPAARARERWERICLEACKQSRRAWLPAVDEPCAPEQVTQRIGDGVRWWVADPQGAPVREALVGEESDEAAGRGAGLVVGPEGGFTGDELERLEAFGVRRLSLGPAILRVEAAAVAGVSALALCAGGGLRR